MTEPEIHIFCQAVGDIQYALSIYAVNRDRAHVTIHVVNTRESILFLKSLDIPDLTLNSIDYPAGPIRLKKLVKAIRMKMAIRQIFRKHFLNTQNATIYFFSEVIDMPTCSLVVKLKERKNRIVFLKHYVRDTHRVSSLPPNRWCHLLLLRWVYGFHVEICQFGESHIHSHQPTLNLGRYNIEIHPPVIDHEFISGHKYKLNCNSHDAVLVLDTPYIDSLFREDDYVNTLSRVMSIIKDNNLRVVLKPHPRIPQHRMYEGLVDDVIPSYVPAEFLPAAQFKYILGFYSTAMIPLSQQPGTQVFSAVDLLPWRFEGDRLHSTSCLHRCESSIRFISSFTGLKELLI